MRIFENKYIYVEIHESQNPWVKIFTQTPHKELSELDDKSRAVLFDAAFLIEKEILLYFKPDKVNWASFGNMLPRVHLHIQARFMDDAYFPEPMWGQKQREFLPAFADKEIFYKELAHKMQSCLKNI